MKWKNCKIRCNPHVHIYILYYFSILNEQKASSAYAITYNIMKKSTTSQQEYKSLINWRIIPKIKSWYGKYLDKQYKRATIVDMTDDWRER